MPVLRDRMSAGSTESCRPGLDFAYELLAGPASESLTLDRLLARLARAFGAVAAGFAGPLGSQTPIVRRVRENGQPLPSGPWLEHDQGRIAAHSPGAHFTATLEHPKLGSCLQTDVQMSDGSNWLLWLEEAVGHVWSTSEAATLTLAGLALGRWTAAAGNPSPLVQQLARANRCRHLDDAARVARRLAHDFGNILTGILGFNELALNHAPAGSPLLHYLQESNRAAQQGAELTHLLRLFGCRRATQLQLVPLETAVLAEVNRLRLSLRPDVVLDLSIPSALPPVAVSEELLHTLLGQLLANAREALSGPGTIALSARATELEAMEAAELLGNARPGPCVEVCLRDTGCGMSADTLGRLFVEPFFSTKPRHRGLGLAAVYGILYAHGGGFRIEPKPQGGTRVHVFLPVAVAVAALPASSGGPAHGERVLVVDDDQAVLQFVGKTLQLAGYRVETVDCPVKAMDSFAAAAVEPFHLVVSDVRMPEMNGFDLAHRLRSRDASVALLFMSGQTHADLAEVHGVPGPYDMLFKPFRPEGLLRAVRTALDRGSQRTRAGDGGPGEELVNPSFRNAP